MYMLFSTRCNIHIHKKQRMYMLFITRRNMNMFFKQINQSTCHLICFDEQSIYMSLDIF